MKQETTTGETEDPEQDPGIEKDIQLPEDTEARKAADAVYAMNILSMGFAFAGHF